MLFVADRWTGPYQVLDVSIGGARLVGEADLLPGTWVVSVFHLPGPATVSVAGTVVWRGDAPRREFAISFMELAPEDETTLRACERNSSSDVLPV